ncbi:MAG: hypothetical protein ORN55_01245 [Chitinophagaceae bacterium]|nr:hypothetical protein [Chitinophagaceae bacterium]
MLQRTTIAAADLVGNAKFIQVFQRSEDGIATILEIDKLSKYDLVAS